MDYLRVVVHLLVLIQVLFLEERSVFVCACDVGPDFIEIGGCDEGFYFIQQLLDLHVPGESRVDFDGRLQVGLIGLDSKYYFEHGVENHFRFLSDYMAEIGHKFFELLLVVEETFTGKEGEGD